MVNQSYRIGRIFGIDIELHWTFIALLLLTLFLSTYLFVLIILLFACVLIHELSHCFVSLRNKVKVSRIILLPMGGASVIDEVKLDPRIEFNIAIAGPLMSMLLGCLFGVMVVLAPPGPANQMFQFLFEVNLLLAVFNILPAFPTDGGRVFRSYLERRYNQYKATLLTVRAGNVVMGLIVLGTLAFVVALNAPFYTKEFVFLWNLMIVFFLYQGARTEKELMEMRHYSKSIRVSEVASKQFILVKPEDGAQKLYDTVRKKKIHLLITKIGGDYAYVNLLRKEKLKPGVRAQDIATVIPSIELNANIIDAFEKMEANEIGIAAVTSRKKIVGIVTLTHLQAFISLHILGAMKEK
jgi:Zn-dependent protease